MRFEFRRCGPHELPVGRGNGAAPLERPAFLSGHGVLILKKPGWPIARGACSTGLRRARSGCWLCHGNCARGRGRRWISLLLRDCGWMKMMKIYGGEMQSLERRWRPSEMPPRNSWLRRFAEDLEISNNTSLRGLGSAASVARWSVPCLSCHVRTLQRHCWKVIKLVTEGCRPGRWCPAGRAGAPGKLRPGRS